MSEGNETAFKIPSDTRSIGKNVFSWLVLRPVGLFYPIGTPFFHLLATIISSIPLVKHDSRRIDFYECSTEARVKSYDQLQLSRVVLNPDKKDFIQNILKSYRKKNPSEFKTEFLKNEKSTSAVMFSTEGGIFKNSATETDNYKSEKMILMEPLLGKEIMPVDSSVQPQNHNIPILLPSTPERVTEDNISQLARKDNFEEILDVNCDGLNMKVATALGNEIQLDNVSIMVNVEKSTGSGSATNSCQKLFSHDLVEFSTEDKSLQQEHLKKSSPCDEGKNVLNKISSRKVLSLEESQKEKEEAHVKDVPDVIQKDNNYHAMGIVQEPFEVLLRESSVVSEITPRKAIIVNIDEDCLENKAKSHNLRNREENVLVTPTLTRKKGKVGSFSQAFFMVSQSVFELQGEQEPNVDLSPVLAFESVGVEDWLKSETNLCASNWFSGPPCQNEPTVEHGLCLACDSAVTPNSRQARPFSAEREIAKSPSGKRSAKHSPGKETRSPMERQSPQEKGISHEKRSPIGKGRADKVKSPQSKRSPQESRSPVNRKLSNTPTKMKQLPLESKNSPLRSAPEKCEIYLQSKTASPKAGLSQKPNEEKKLLTEANRPLLTSPQKASPPLKAREKISRVPKYSAKKPPRPQSKPSSEEFKELQVKESLVKSQQQKVEIRKRVSRSEDDIDAIFAKNFLQDTAAESLFDPTMDNWLYEQVLPELPSDV